TSWTNPRENYEERLLAFLHAILDPSRSSEFMRSISAFAQRPFLLGALNSLSQLVLKLTLPGVPDFYQGTELWDFSLVDPDNRRPVNYPLRAAWLQDLEVTHWSALVTNWPDGRIKLAWTRELLRLRGSYSDLFSKGDYM